MPSDDQTGPPSQTFGTGGEPPAPGGALEADSLAALPAAREPGYLLFRSAGVDCAVPLAALREVLPDCPVALPLPHSPEWLLGVFALRAELVGLVDPAPLLFGTASDRSAPRSHGAALLASVGEQVLAWAVESIGAVAPLAPESNAEADDRQAEGDFAPSVADTDTGNLSGTLVALRQSVAPAYAADEVTQAGQRYTVINVEALLADMLRALEERPAHV